MMQCSHGRRKDFFQGGGNSGVFPKKLKNFPKGDKKQWSFILTALETEKKNFFAKNKKFNRNISNLKFQGGLIPPKGDKNTHVSN